MDFHDTPLGEIERRIADSLGIDEVQIRALEFADPPPHLVLAAKRKTRLTLSIVVSEIYGSDR